MLSLLAGVGGGGSGSVFAQEPAAPSEEAGDPDAVPSGNLPVSVLDWPNTHPEYVQTQARLAAAFQQKNYALAKQLLERLLELSPYDPGDHYNMACALALLGEKEAALEHLETAVNCGFRNADHLLADADLISLRGDPRLQAQADRARELGPSGHRDRLAPVDDTPVADGVAEVTEANTAWDQRLGVFHTFFEFPDSPMDGAEVVTGLRAERRLLRSWYKDGTAAGLHGILYDNFDGDHSNLAYVQFPQLTRVEYGPGFRGRDYHRGLQLKFFHNAPTFGNSSTANVGGPFWRSQPRAACTTPRGVGLLVAQYRSNHLYVYPEHRDHDPGHNGRDGGGFGDVYSSNTPYLLISQGSSGSDRVFLDAIASILAAFHPDTREKLIASGLLMPTVQMVFRRGYDGVRTRDEYLSQRAHPTVFDGEKLDVEHMVKMAHTIRPDALPPLAQLQVVEEDVAPFGLSEMLFNSPHAIARVFRGFGESRRMVVSAQGSGDVQGKPLSYHWKVLRGDENRITIRPLNDEGSVAEVIVGYHTRRPVKTGSDLESNRVDIGVFVDNGVELSAPAFLCTYFLDYETRRYDVDGRLTVLDFTDDGARDNYVDPLVEARRDWRDEFHYDAAGKLLGWTRQRGAESWEFTADGRGVLEHSQDGRVVGMRAVGYRVEQDADGKGAGAPQMRMVLADEVQALPE